MISQEQNDILENLTTTELTYTFSSLGFTEGQYKFYGGSSSVQGQN